jgi:hypothetical protein
MCLPNEGITLSYESPILSKNIRCPFASQFWVILNV